MLSFDLEGISTDGFGHTVTITGPLRPRSNKNIGDWFKAPRMNILDMKGRKGGPPPSVMRQLEIPVETEVAIETYSARLGWMDNNTAKTVYVDGP